MSSWSGEALAGRRCPKCGAEADRESRFCERCGAEVAPAAATWAGSQPARTTIPDADLGGEPTGGDATQTYLGYRLVYSDLSTDFNPLSNATFQRTLLYQFLATIALWVVVTGALGVLQIFGVLLNLESGDSAQASSLFFDGLPAVTGISSTLFSIALACVFWFRPLSVQLSEWMITIDGAGNRARAALEHMYLIVHNRQTPVRSLQVVRLRAARQQQRDYLRFDDGHFSGFVSSFNYGTDLFIGWTFWLTMSPAQWLWWSVRRMFRAASDNIYGSLTNDQPKAMREVMHAAVRQGVDMATGRIEPRGQGSLGSTVPITSVDA